jgi:hypothetical protein
MADDLKKLLTKVQQFKGKKSYSYGYVAGKRKDGEGDGHLELINSRKPFKKEDLAEEVQSVQSFVTGKCWGNTEGTGIYVKGKGLNERLVALINKTVKKQTGKAFDILLPDEVEEQRQENLEAASGSETDEASDEQPPPPTTAPPTATSSAPTAPTGGTPPPPAGAAEYQTLRAQVEGKLNQLKAHAEKAVVPTELALFDTKMAAAAEKATGGKYPEAKQLLTQVDTALGAVKALADKAATVKKHYADWAVAPLASLKANPQKAQITAEIAAIEVKKTQADAKIAARKFDEADTLIKQIYWDCDAAKKSLVYVAARAIAQAKIDTLKNHAQKGDIAGEIAELEAKMVDAAGKATAKKYDQAIALITQVPVLAARATVLADKLRDTAAKVAVFTKTLKDGGMSDTDAAKAAKYAHKILAGENCDDAKAIKMAKTAMTLSTEGFSDDRAVLGAKVNQALLDDGMDEEKAGVVTRITKSGGTATVEDAKTVARGMKVFPTKMLKTMKANGTTMVACEGPITDYRVDLKGVHPRDWPEGSTWDSVPGVHMGATKEVAIGTMNDGTGKRKVPGPGEGPVKHGAFNLIAHEGGHGFDSDSTPAKDTTPEFQTARTKDITDGKMVAPKDSYFLQAGNAGLQETFAESCARHFGGDAKMGTDWPALKAFWNHNPWA